MKDTDLDDRFFSLTTAGTGQNTPESSPA